MRASIKTRICDSRQSGLRMKFKGLKPFGYPVHGILDKFEFLTFHICQGRGVVNPSNAMCSRTSETKAIKHFFYFIL